MSGRTHLSIGDVLSLLRGEFPDVTISKIRFLESQGLVDPERSPSGYRKFYERDIERLRWVLRQQREHFLPLKVIRDRLDEGAAESSDETGAAGSLLVSWNAEAGNAAPAEAGECASFAGAEPLETSAGRGRTGERGAQPALALAGTSQVLAVPAEAKARGIGADSVRALPDDRVAPGAGPSGRPGGGAPADDGAPVGEQQLPSRSATVDAARPPAQERTDVGEVSKRRGDESDGAAVQFEMPVGAPGASLTAEELCAATGLTVSDLMSLEGFGLIETTTVAGSVYYDEAAVAVASLVSQFARFGIEPRHLRQYRNAAERESGLIEQVVAPLLRQRNPESRQRAVEAVSEISQLGQSMRSALLRRELRRTIG